MIKRNKSVILLDFYRFYQFHTGFDRIDLQWMKIKQKYAFISFHQMNTSRQDCDCVVVKKRVFENSKISAQFRFTTHTSKYRILSLNVYHF